MLIGEVGGTVGDIESLPFLEAIRQLRWDRGRENVLYVHLTLVPYIATAGELKTKPTQHSVKELTGLGIQPDILLCRTDRLLDRKIKAKIALFCNVDENAVITAQDVECIYEVPLVFHEEGLDERIVELLNMWTGRAEPEPLGSKVVQTVKHPREHVRIAMVGKYVDLTTPTRASTRRSCTAASPTSARSTLDYVDSEEIEQDGAAPSCRGGRRHPRADGLRAARHRGQDRRGALRARGARCRSSASASACRWR